MNPLSLVLPRCLINRRPGPRPWRLGMAGLFGLFLMGSGPVGLAAAVDQAALLAALDQLPNYEWGQPETSLLVIDNAVAAASQDDALRRQIETRLADLLGATATPAAKKYACRKLSMIGSAAAVPSLARLLPDQELSHMARFALERIDDSAVDPALRGALPQTDGLLRAGVIYSLGNRRDSAAVPILREQLNQPDAEGIRASLAALGLIATPEAGEVLVAFRSRVAPGDLFILEDALLKAAEAVAASDQAQLSLGWYRDLQANGSQPHVRLAAFKGLLGLEPNLAPQRLLEALASDDPKIRGLAARTIRELPDHTVMDRYLTALPQLPPAGQAALIEALAARQVTAARPALRQAASHEEAMVRLAALAALGSLGQPADALLLAEKAASDFPAEAQVARRSLVTLPGPAVDAALTEALAAAPAPVRIEMIRALVSRQSAASVAVLARFMEDDQLSVRLAAVEALGILGGAAQVPAVLARLQSAGDAAEEAALEQTLKTLCHREPVASGATILAALPALEGSRRIVLLNTLNLIGTPEALALVRADLPSGNPAVQEAARRVLASWPNGQAMPELLNQAKSAPELSQRVVAFRGYVRLLRASDQPADQKARALGEAMGVAQRPEERLLILAGWAELPNLDALKRAEKHLYDRAIAEEACVTLIRIAGGLDPAARYDAAVALEQVLRITQSPETRETATKLFDKLQVPRLAASPAAAPSPEVKRIILLAGPMDHAGPGAHEYPKDLLLLKACLDHAPQAKAVQTEIFFGPHPPDIAVLEKAACVVVHSSADRLPWEAHALFPPSGQQATRPYTDAEQQYFDRLNQLMKQGLGLVVFHYALWTDHPQSRAALLDWIGGYHDKDRSRVQIVTAPVTPATPDHPITRGVRSWNLREEYYFEQHFRPDDTRRVPILRIPSPTDAQAQDTIAWAVERDGGGRGFGFTGCHYHSSLAVEDYRRLVLNALLWAAGLDVPEGGLASTLPEGWQ